MPVARARRERTQDPLGGGVERCRRRGPAQEPVEHRGRDVLDLARLLEHRTHQPVDRRESGLVREAHRRRDRGLLLGEEPVRTPARLQVERAPDPREELLGAVDRTMFRLAQDARLLERAADRGPDPRERVDVAEPTDALLELGFEQGRDGAEPLAPGVAIGHQALGERARIAADGREHRRTDVVPSRRGSREEPAVEHRRRRIEPFGRDLDADLRRSDRVTDAQAGVPQRVQQGLGERRDRVRRPPLVQDQQVEIGAGRERPASVPTERDERDVLGHPGGGREIAEAAIDELGAATPGPPAVMARRVRAVERTEVLQEPADRRGPLAHARGRRDPSRRSGSAGPARRASPRSCRRRSCRCERPSRAHRRSRSPARPRTAPRP